MPCLLRLTMISLSSHCVSLCISAFEIDQYVIYDYHYAYTWKRWALYGLNEDQWHLLDQRNTSAFSQKFSTFSYSIQGTTFPYHRYRVNILGTSKEWWSCVENWGYKVTWFSELFPYVVNARFEHPLYTHNSVDLNYNIRFSIASLFSEDELRKENITFSIMPQLPANVSLDSRTGRIHGQFVGVVGWLEWRVMTRRRRTFTLLPLRARNTETCRCWCWDCQVGVKQLTDH